MTQKLRTNTNNKLDEYKNPLTKTQQHIMKYLLKHPGRNGKEISKKVKSVSESTIQEHIRKLKNKDMLTTTSRDGYIVSDKGVKQIENTKTKETHNDI